MKAPVLILAASIMFICSRLANATSATELCIIPKISGIKKMTSTCLAIVLRISFRSKPIFFKISYVATSL